MLSFQDNAKAAVLKVETDPVDRETVEIVRCVMDRVQEGDREVQRPVPAQYAPDFRQHRRVWPDVFQYLEQ